MLRRYVGEDFKPALAQVLLEGERWSAELLESHLSYPLPGPSPSLPLTGMPETVALRALVSVASIAFVDRAETLAALRDLHVWSDETMARRFHYRKPGLWVLGVRVFSRRSEPHRLAVTAEHAAPTSACPRTPSPALPKSSGSLRIAAAPMIGVASRNA